VIYNKHRPTPITNIPVIEREEVVCEREVARVTAPCSPNNNIWNY
jgi:hypothetical protein